MSLKVVTTSESGWQFNRLFVGLSFGLIIGPRFGPSVKLEGTYLQTAQIAILGAQSNDPRIGPTFGRSFGPRFFKSIELPSRDPTVQWGCLLCDVCAVLEPLTGVLPFFLLPVPPTDCHCCCAAPAIIDPLESSDFGDSMKLKSGTADLNRNYVHSHSNHNSVCRPFSPRD